VPLFLFSFVGFVLACVSWKSTLSTTWFFADAPGPMCKMNVLGTGASVLFAASSAHWCMWRLWCRSGRGCGGFCCEPSPASTANIDLRADRNINLLLRLNYALNWLAVLAVSFNFTGESLVFRRAPPTARYPTRAPTPSPTRYPTPAAVPGGGQPAPAPTRISDANAWSCQAINDVTRWKRQCAGGHFSCDYNPPGVWTALLVMLVLALVINTLLILALRVAKRQARRGGAGNTGQQLLAVPGQQQQQQQLPQQQAGLLQQQPSAVGAFAMASAPPLQPWDAAGAAGGGAGFDSSVPMAQPVAAPVGGPGGVVDASALGGKADPGTKPSASSGGGDGGGGGGGGGTVGSLSVFALGTWLHSIGKGAYVQPLADAGIDGATLCAPGTTAPLLVEAVPSLPLIIAQSIIRAAQEQG
jgi:hypothetical protein